MAYQDPGGAFSNGLEHVMMQREVLRRQAMLDAITQQREERLGRAEEMDIQLRRETLAEKQKDAAIKNHMTKRQSLVPGDIPDPELINEAKKLGIPLRLTAPQTSTIPAGKDMVQMPGADAPVAMPGAQPAQALTAGGGAYEGTPQQFARRQMADAIERGDDPSKILAQSLRQGVEDPKEIEGVISSIRGPKPQAEPTLVAKGPDGKTIGGIVSMTAQGMPLLDGKPLPAGVSVHRMDPANAGTVHDTAKGLVRIMPDNSIVPLGVQGFHPAPQPVIFRSDAGPVIVDKSKGTSREVTAPGGGALRPEETAQTRAMSEGARMLAPHIPELDAMAQDLEKRGLFGPVMSRVRAAAAKLGTALDPGDPDKSSQAWQALGQAVMNDPGLPDDEVVGQFATALGLMASGAGRVHGGSRGGGSIQMIDYMKSLLSDASSYKMFRGRLKGLDTYISGYAKGAKGTAAAPAEGTPETKTPAPTSKYKVTVTKPGGDD